MSGNGKESVRLDAVYINRWKLNSRDVFTINDAAQYWAEYAELMPGDNKAIFEYNDIFNMLYRAFEEGDLELCELVEHDWSLLLTARPVFTREGIDYNFGWCKVDRYSLIKFAHIVGEYPLFLFPNGKPDDKQAENDSQTENVKSDKRENKKLITKEKYKEIIADANDVIYKTSSTYHMSGDHYHCANIAKKLFIDRYESIAGRKESSVVKLLCKYRDDLQSKKKEKQ